MADSKRGSSATYFEDILALIAGGMTGVEACSSNPSHPNYRSFTDHARKTGQMDRVKQAWRGREASANARMKTNVRYTEADFDEALAVIAANPDKAERRIFATVMPDRLPTRTVVMARRLRDAVFAERYAAMQAQRPSTIARGPNYQVLAKGRAAYVPKVQLPSGMLAQSLSSNPLFAAADRVVPRTLQPDARADIIADMIEAVLAGTVKVDELQTRSTRFVRTWFASFASPYQRSLDEKSFGDDEPETLLDRFGSQEWSAEAFA